jgi:hypothetical protein
VNLSGWARMRCVQGRVFWAGVVLIGILIDAWTITPHIQAQHATGRFAGR